MATISVVMPLFNGAAHVGPAVTSLLAQADDDTELILVDDASTDGGADIVRALEPRATVLVRTEPGVAAARNLGIQEATGEYLTFLDADDILPERSLAVRLAALDGDASLAAVFGRMEEFVTEGLDSGAAARLRTPVGPTDARLASTMLIRRQDFLDVGLLDPGAGRWYFMDWLARFSASGLAWSQIPDLVLRRRLHATNSGLALEAQPSQLLGTLRASLARRKESPELP
jgi:glycosyltransferase involved in cell wall biosynthesis